MKHFFKTDSRLALKAVAMTTALALAACGGDTGTSSAANNNAAGASVYEIENDHVIGNPNAKVTIVEHASVMCGACANWHNTVYPDLKKKYIDTGLVRFVFREFPTAPENLAQAGFLIANCTGSDKFFENIKLQFNRQPQIFKAMQSGTVLNEYIAIGKAGGLSEEETMACLKDETQIANYEAKVQNGLDNGVTSTPTFFINGEKAGRTADGELVFKLDAFDELLRPILGEEATKSSEPETDKVE